MAAPKFEVPELKGYTEIPLLREGATADVKSFPANAQIQEALGFPGELVENWH
ncbi:MAG TPA: reductase, partial [Betaproteobacteria bacterium]|nr:reductase [Betaproteobacteria bacterium]